MRGAKGVVDALGSFCESGQSSALTQRAHTRAPAGQNFLRIGRMTDVPNALVVWRVEDASQPNSTGSVPVGPDAPWTIFSSRPSAAFNFFSQCALSACPRS